MPAALDEFGGQVEPEDFIAIGWGTLSVSKEIVKCELCISRID